GERDATVRRISGDLLGKVARVVHRLAVDAGDDVAGFQAGLRRRAIRLRLGDQRALALMQVEAVGDLGRHRLDLHAEPAALDMAVGAKLRHHALHGRGRDVEGNADRAAGRRIDGCVYANHFTFQVEGRSAGITLVDGG